MLLSACMYQASPADFQTTTHWNVTSRSMTAPPPVVSPSSILPSLSSRRAFVPAKESTRWDFQKRHLSCFYLFRRVLKIAKGDYQLHVRLCVRPHGTTRLPLNGLWLNLILELFCRKSVEKIQVSLKSEKSNGYFTWRRFDIYDSSSLNPSQDEKCFKWKL